MMPDEDEPTPEELEEAERLARALERGNAPGGVPEDALATAALLRYAKDGGALDPHRGRAIFEDAVKNARPIRAAKRRIRFTLFGLLGLAAAGAASIALVVRTQSPEPSASLPAPPRALLEAQLAAASGGPANLDALAVRTAEYRGRVYASLRERYGK
jgi:hypothetical protein